MFTFVFTYVKVTSNKRKPLGFILVNKKLTDLSFFRSLYIADRGKTVKVRDGFDLTVARKGTRVKFHDLTRPTD